MRTFLTYVLAAVCAGALVTLIVSGRHHFDLFSGILDGRYRAVAGLNPLIEWSVRAIGYLIGLGLPALIVSRFARVNRAWGSLVSALAVGVLLASVAFVIVWVGYLMIAPLIGIASEPVTMEVWLELAIAGLAWGTVFWLRAPKPQTAGIAA